MISKNNLLVAAVVGLLAAPGCALFAQNAPKANAAKPPSLDSAIFGGNIAIPTDTWTLITQSQRPY